MKKIAEKNEFIIPLAALVGAPLCQKNKKEAVIVNYDSITKLLQNFRPSEVLVSKQQKADFKQHFGEDFHVFYLEDWIYKEDYAFEILTNHFQSARHHEGRYWVNSRHCEVPRLVASAFRPVTTLDLASIERSQDGCQCPMAP